MGISESEFEQLRLNQQIANGASFTGKRPRISPSEMAERELERICTQVLIHDGWRALKTDPVSDRKRGKGFGELGMVDYLYLRYNDQFMLATLQSTERLYRSQVELMWIEWKRPSGVVAEHQKRWHAEERAKGALVVVATEDFPATVEGFLAWYEQSGLKRA